MDKIDIGHHISQRYNQELEEIRNQVLAMGGLVEQQLNNALQAYSNRDAAMAEQVIKDDYQVNALEVAIDEECTQVLARRQPAASDLRLIVSVIKTITDLERIGDETGKVAKMTTALAESGNNSEHGIEIEHLGNRVRQILHDALDAFARTDVDAALKVAQEDIKVDREYESLMRQLITYMMEDPRTIRRSLDLMWTIRALERIGDHSRNICEYVIYLVKGRDVRHISLEQMEEEAGKR
ncbi:Phosphate transport system regulatory protein PhoU [hydrothermal vent metagenome]|uniref:Phosphate transport system regulatory protein PhoU n=1 Tax=hydrothermal vent metagenome TaxID=652676 RepID=A0A3B0Z9H7_9ZZZZ